MLISFPIRFVIVMKTFQSKSDFLIPGTYDIKVLSRVLSHKKTKNHGLKSTRMMVMPVMGLRRQRSSKLQDRIQTLLPVYCRHVPDF